MDILKEIEKQIESIKVEDNSAYLDQIYSHLDRAELYYKQGQNDEQYFNDVIYRSNQAYEGALKESYKVLAGKTEAELSKTTPHKIEAHLKDNNIFRDRVLQLFENYRQEWRNKSTHDYKLIFKQDEAFIALTSVTSFVHLLLREILEKLAYNKEIRRKNIIAKFQELNELLEQDDKSLAEKIVKLLFEFTESSIINAVHTAMFEVEILGMLHGFLSKSNEDLEVIREPRLLSNNQVMRPDFIVEYGNEKVVLEIKRQFSRQRLQPAIHQVLSYLQAADVANGILYFVKTVDGKLVPKVDKQELNSDGKTFTVYIVTT